MMNFVLLGAAGFVAPRHLQAIKEVGGNLMAAVDPHDSVGVLDSYFPNCQFFKTIDELNEYLHSAPNVDYFSICTPNYLHAEHIKLAHSHGAKAICEKPLVLTIQELNDLKGDVFTILQLRLHPEIIRLKSVIRDEEFYEVNIYYLTSRGPWYDKSWKGDILKSGGVCMNIGVHLFDMLVYLFGPVEDAQADDLQAHRASGYLEFKNARVMFELSTNLNDIPDVYRAKGMWRHMSVNGNGVEFSKGFSDLHTESYRQILAGNGFGVEDARASIELIHKFHR